MDIREASADDRSTAIGLWEAAGLTRPWNDPVADFDRALANPTSTVLLALDAGTVVGTAMIGYDGHRGWMYYLAVDESRRKEDIGTALVRSSEEWLAALGAPAVRLMVRSENAGVVAFYASLGYSDQDSTVMGRSLLAPCGS